MIFLNIRKLLRSFQSIETFRLKNITKKNLPYFFGWIAVFIWLYSFFLPMGDFRIVIDKYATSQVHTYMWLITCPIIVVVFNGEKYISRTIYSTLIGLVSFSIVRFFEYGLFETLLLIITSFCIGHIFASTAYGFFVILNNGEKFYAMLLGVLIPKLLMVFRPYIHNLFLYLDIPSFLMYFVLFTVLICSLFYRDTSKEDHLSNESKAPKKAYALMPVVFAVLAFNDVIVPASMKNLSKVSSEIVYNYYFLGIIIGTVSILILQKVLRVSICNMINLSFAFLILGFVFNIFTRESYSFCLIAVFLWGLAYVIGFVNIYYLAGFMTKKFLSAYFYRVGIVLSSVYYFVAFFVLHFDKTSSYVISTFITIISICILITFLILTPFFVSTLYSGEWIDDMYRYDVTKGSRLEIRLRSYKLTPAEIEVCKLLLEGYTLRQISAIQYKSYSTINTYCVSVYRKMGINSRTELLRTLKEYLQF